MMEGDQYHNSGSATVVYVEDKEISLNEATSNEPSTGASIEIKFPHTPISVWVKEVNYSDDYQR